MTCYRRFDIHDLRRFAPNKLTQKRHLLDSIQRTQESQPRNASKISRQYDADMSDARAPIIEA